MRPYYGVYIYICICTVRWKQIKSKKATLRKWKDPSVWKTKEEKKCTNQKEIWIVIMAHTHNTEHTQQITATMWNSTIGACVLIQLYMDLWLCVRKYSINNEADKRNPKLPLMQTLRYNSEFGSCDRLVVWKCVFNVELQYRLEFWFRQSPFSNNLARHNKHSMA